ncbi:MAG: hypothetical protein MRZ32_06800 [Bacteroidales bacterium]|nr:hypothetical protein [Bacteroidales bacterium]MDY2916850.1 hypothetical protein [Muribaculaceae bacterium]
MKTRVYFGILLMVLLTMAGLSACDDHSDLVGDWDPMEWETDANVNIKKTHDISVPAEGGTYQFMCTNYSRVWMAGALEGEQYVIPEEGNFHSIVGQMSRVDVKENVMTVVILPNDADSARQVVVTPTAGDTFSSFTFKQAGR